MSWKHTFDMLRMIPALHQYFPINEYNEYFLEEVFVILKSGNGQTKPVAATALCDLLWQNHHSSKRNGILAKVLLLAQSTSYYERISFMWFCVSAFQRFSQNAIKAQGLVSALLKLANDRVSNTRIRFLEITKNLIIYMKEATQKEIIDKVKELQDDKNKDVKKTAVKTLETIQKLLENNEEIQEKIDEHEEQKVANEKKLLKMVLLARRLIHKL